MKTLKRAAALAVVGLLAAATVALAATITGTPGNDTLVGTAQTDTITGSAATTRSSGSAATTRSTPAAATTPSTATASARPARRFPQYCTQGNSGDDTIDGGSGSDTISGGAGSDTDRRRRRRRPHQRRRRQRRHRRRRRQRPHRRQRRRGPDRAATTATTRSPATTGSTGSAATTATTPSTATSGNDQLGGGTGNDRMQRRRRHRPPQRRRRQRPHHRRRRPRHDRRRVGQRRHPRGRRRGRHDHLRQRPRHRARRPTRPCGARLRTRPAQQLSPMASPALLAPTPRGAGRFARPDQQRSLHIQLRSCNYDPEPSGIAPLSAAWAKAMIERGHRVEVVAAHPHYPAPIWGSRRRPYREVLDGVPVLRLPLWIGHDSARQRMRQELAHSAWLGAALPALGRPDVIVAVSPSFPALLPTMIDARTQGRPVDAVAPGHPPRRRRDHGADPLGPAPDRPQGARADRLPQRGPHLRHLRGLPAQPRRQGRPRGEDDADLQPLGGPGRLRTAPPSTLRRSGAPAGHGQHRPLPGPGRVRLRDRARRRARRVRRGAADRRPRLRARRRRARRSAARASSCSGCCTATTMERGAANGDARPRHPALRHHRVQPAVEAHELHGARLPVLAVVDPRLGVRARSSASPAPAGSSTPRGSTECPDLLRGVLADPAALLARGRAAHAFAAEHFSPERVVEGFEQDLLALTARR